MQEIAYVNGVFCDLCDAKVSIEDRGYQFGDGVYEVVVAYSGQPFLLDKHLARLRRSLSAIWIDYDLTSRPLEPIIAEGLERTGLGDAMVYIQITRGVAPRSHAIPEHCSPTLAMTFKPLPQVPEGLRRRGARLMTTPDPRWVRCDIKAVTLLPNVLAKSRAIAAGFDDVLFVAAEGQARECSSSNVFSVNDGRITFPPRNEAVLHGVTQGFLVQCAAAVGCRMEEQPIDVEKLVRSDEVFISSTILEVLGVTYIDGHQINGGAVGPVTQRILAEYRRQSRVLAVQAAS